jgi:thioredoxin-like negative regulator of GroEL
MTPIVHGLEAEFSNQMTFYVLNVGPGATNNQALQAAYELRGHPTIALVDANGQKVAQFYGRVPAETLRQSLQTLLAPVE